MARSSTHDHIPTITGIKPDAQWQPKRMTWKDICPPDTRLKLLSFGGGVAVSVGANVLVTAGLVGLGVTGAFALVATAGAGILAGAVYGHVLKNKAAKAEGRAPEAFFGKQMGKSLFKSALTVAAVAGVAAMGVGAAFAAMAAVVTVVAAGAVNDHRKQAKADNKKFFTKELFNTLASPKTAKRAFWSLIGASAALFIGNAVAGNLPSLSTSGGEATGPMGLANSFNELTTAPATFSPDPIPEPVAMGDDFTPLPLDYVAPEAEPVVAAAAPAPAPIAAPAAAAQPVAAAPAAAATVASAPAAAPQVAIAAPAPMPVPIASAPIADVVGEVAPAVKTWAPATLPPDGTATAAPAAEPAVAPPLADAEIPKAWAPAALPGEAAAPPTAEPEPAAAAPAAWAPAALPADAAVPAPAPAATPAPAGEMAARCVVRENFNAYSVGESNYPPEPPAADAALSPEYRVNCEIIKPIAGKGDFVSVDVIANNGTGAQQFNAQNTLNFGTRETEVWAKSWVVPDMMKIVGNTLFEGRIFSPTLKVN